METQSIFVEMEAASLEEHMSLHSTETWGICSAIIRAEIMLASFVTLYLLAAINRTRLSGKHVDGSIMATPKGSAAYKKRDGTLALSKDAQSVSWTPTAPPGSPPAVTLPVSSITSEYER